MLFCHELRLIAVSTSITHNRLTPPVNISPEIARRAVEWLMEWQSADHPEEVWQSIISWRRAHHQHEQAWRQIERVNEKLGVLSSPRHSVVAHRTLATPASRRGMSRRDALKTLSVLVLVSGGGTLVYRQQPWQEWLADYSTRVGQQQQITLADDTRITLNSNTAIKVRYTATERRVTLVKGEVYVRTGKVTGELSGKQRDDPFILEVAQGQLQPLGTRFAARHIDKVCRVAVYDGRVQVQPTLNEQSVIVDSGQSITFTQNYWSNFIPVEEAEAAWTQGIIVASGMPLQDFLVELNRHRPGLIQCDPAIAQLKVSGTYPMNQADDVLKALSRALPISLKSFTRYWVRVLPADKLNVGVSG